MNPSVNLPRAIMLGMPTLIVLYVMVNISYFTVMTVPELLASPAVGIVSISSVSFTSVFNSFQIPALRFKWTVHEITNTNLANRESLSD